MNEGQDEPAPKDLFLSSLERCASDVERFIPSFYQRFMATSEEVRAKFRFTSLETQSRMLLSSLRLCASAVNGEPEGLMELSERAQTHDRHNLDIEAPLYELWLDSLIATAEEFDSEWNGTVDDAWRTVLGFVINRMISKY